MSESADLSALPDAIEAARELLRLHVRLTPFERSIALSARLLGDVWLKGEHLQHTGSFKARGALHKVLRLTTKERSAGVVSASSGNHGAALAWSCQRAGVPAVIYVPAQASPTKVAMIRRYGAAVKVFGTDGLDTEQQAREVAARGGLTYVSPYNDVEVLCGQGTVGVEMEEQGERLDTVVVAVGGGGLIGGVAAYLKHVTPGVRVIGAVPANSPVMAESVAAGHIVSRESFPTLSDGTAGGIEPDSLTFPICRALVDEWMQLSEQEIAAAMRRFIEEHHQLIEGSAGVALAALERRALLGGAGGLGGERVGVVLCGANISNEKLAQLLSTP